MKAVTLSLAVLLAFALPAAAGPKKVARKPLVASKLPAGTRATFIGRLVEVGRAPGFWSGIAVALQLVTYEVVKTDSDKLPRRITVPWGIVASSNLVGPKTELRADLRRLGELYEVTVHQDEYYGLLGDDVRVAKK